MLSGLGALGAQAVRDPSAFITQTLPSLPGAIARDYEARYGLMPGGQAPHLPSFEEVYENPAPYLFDAIDASALGYGAKRGVTSLLDAPLPTGATRRSMLPELLADESGALRWQAFRGEHSPAELAQLQRESIYGSRPSVASPASPRPSQPPLPGPVEVQAGMGQPPVQPRAPRLQPEALARDLIYKYRTPEDVKGAIIGRVRTGQLSEAEAATALDQVDEIFADPTLQTGLDQRVLEFQDFQANAPSANAGGTGGSPLLTPGPQGPITTMQGPEGAYTAMRHPAAIDRTPTFSSQAELARMPEFRDLTQDEVADLLSQQLGREATPAEVSEFIRTTPPSRMQVPSQSYRKATYGGRKGGPSDWQEAPEGYRTALRSQLAPQHGPPQVEGFEFPAAERIHQEMVAEAKGPLFSPEAAPSALLNEDILRAGNRAERANIDRFARAPVHPSRTTPLDPRAGTAHADVDRLGTSLARKHGRAEAVAESEMYPNPLDDAIPTRRTLGELSDEELSGLLDQAIANRMEYAQGLDALDGDLADAAVHAARIIRFRGGGGAEQFSMKYGDVSRDVFNTGAQGTAIAEAPFDPEMLARMLEGQPGVQGAVQPAPRDMLSAYQERAYAEDVGKVRRKEMTDAQKTTRRRTMQEKRRPAEQVTERGGVRTEGKSKRRSQQEKSASTSTSQPTVRVGNKDLTQAQIEKKLAYWRKEGVSNEYTAKLEEGLQKLQGGESGFIGGEASVSELTQTSPTEEFLGGAGVVDPMQIVTDRLLKALTEGKIDTATFTEAMNELVNGRKAGGTLDYVDATDDIPAQAATNVKTSTKRRESSSSSSTSTKRKSAKEKGLVDISTMKTTKLKNRLKFRKDRGEDNEFTRAIEAELRKRGEL